MVLYFSALTHFGRDFQYGEVSEGFKELVLKTSDSQEPWVRIPPSPPKNFFCGKRVRKDFHLL